jgi:sulfite exporter TauE/SafE
MIMPIALLQVFSVGLGLGFTGPCLIACAPVVLSFVSGIKQDYRKSLFDILVFFGGRLSAYVLLGCLAGISAMLLRGLIDSEFKTYLNPLAGAISIGLAVIVLLNKDKPENKCPVVSHKAGVSGGLFIFGFIIGLSPCAPLAALLFEITLISENALQGALYGLFFGLGTTLAGFIVTAGLAGILTRVPGKLLGSPAAKIVLKAICVLLLLFFGLWFILGQKR